MVSHEFTKELENKRYTQLYFPDFIRNDYTIISAKSIEELKEKYKAYCKQYDVMYEGASDIYKYPIWRAYQYLLDQKEHPENTTFKNYDIEQLFVSYERLLFSIGEYEFNPRHQKSTGETQTLANQNILLELSMFRSFVLGVLKKLDNKIPTEESEDVNAFDWGLLNYVEDFRKRLEVSSDSLYEKQELYHETWRQSVQPNLFEIKATHEELGKSKREWRKEKKHAYYELLEFFKTLSFMNSSLNSQEEIEDELDKRFCEAMENIQTGPNYYAYLNETSKKHDIESKTYIKQKNKENHSS